MKLPRPESTQKGASESQKSCNLLETSLPRGL